MVLRRSLDETSPRSVGKNERLGVGQERQGMFCSEAVGRSWNVMLLLSVDDICLACIYIDCFVT